MIVLAGTGSMILAITEDGRQVESGQLQHYAGGARHLVFGTLQLILTDDPTPADTPFLAEVLSYWEADDTAQLRERILALETTGPQRGEASVRRPGASGDGQRRHVSHWPTEPCAF